LIYSGACDSLFTPRPLGPLFDIAEQFDQDFIDLLRNEKDRSIIFGALIRKLSASTKPVILIFEDIHWADEGSLDAVEYLTRECQAIPLLLIGLARPSLFERRADQVAVQPGELAVNCLFRGRELANPELAHRVCETVVNGVIDIAKIERAAKIEGRRMTVLLTKK